MGEQHLLDGQQPVGGQHQLDGQQPMGGWDHGVQERSLRDGDSEHHLKSSGEELVLAKVCLASSQNVVEHPCCCSWLHPCCCSCCSWLKIDNIDRFAFLLE